MSGALPPSSIEQFTTLRAAIASSIEPTRVDPVNDNLRIAPESSIASTASPGGSGTTTCTTSSGMPHSRNMSTIASAVSGVSEAGLRTAVQPVAIVGPSLRVAIAAGKFHGVASNDGPTGWRMTSSQFDPDGARR